MAKNPRQSTIDAINRYTERQLAKDKPKRAKHNDAPEKEVEKECLKWMRSLGWHVEIYEAKATWNTEAGAWLGQGMKAGNCDCMGNTNDGFAVAIEFKAPGRLSTINSPCRTLQREFIVNKINTHAFACVVDSVERLQEIWAKWSEFRVFDKDAARQYLHNMLPVSKKAHQDNGPLFDEG